MSALRRSHGNFAKKLFEQRNQRRCVKIKRTLRRRCA